MVGENIQNPERKLLGIYCICWAIYFDPHYKKMSTIEKAHTKVYLLIIWSNIFIVERFESVGSVVDVNDVEFVPSVCGNSLSK